MRVRTCKDDTGAEAIEFAIVLPIVLLLLVGVLWGLLAVVAHMSLEHAASKAARFASIPAPVASGEVGDLDDYPDDTEIVAELDEHTPFFTATDCTPAIVRATDQVANGLITVDVTCRFPNPLGEMLAGLLRANDPAPSGLDLSAHAEARRE